MRSSFLPIKVQRWQYIKWDITQNKGDGITQAADLQFMQGVTGIVWNGTINTTGPENAPNETIVKLTDANASTKWLAFSGTATLTLDNTSPLNAFNGYRIRTANDASGRDPLAWTISASNDGSTWTPLSTVANGGLPATRLAWTGTYSIPSAPYRYIRLNITANQGDAHTQVNEFKFRKSGADVAFNAGVSITTDAPVLATQEITKLIDGLPLTKFGTLNTTVMEINIDNITGLDFDGYMWMNSDENITRGFKDWTLSVSNDGISYRLLDTVVNAPAPALGAWSAEYSI